MKRYEVVDWKEHYENNRTRELKHMAWVPIPNKQDGDGYTELLDHPNGAAHFGAWNALLQVASKCDPRGSLLRDSGYPHDNVSLSRMTRIPEKVWNEALPRLVKIGWITFCDIPQDDASKPQDDAGECPRTEQKGTERKEKKGTIPQEDIDRIYHLWPTSTAKRSRVGRSLKDKDKIRRILTDGKYPLESSVVEYLKTCGDYPKDLATFLNNLPDMTPEPKKETMEQRLRRECAEAVERDANAKR